ncbi:MAG: ABC transporter permease subunit [Candidatus Poseidoniaceae archaeon]|jgi:sodium transport system permease protein|nr:ABC transporter permease subunit [Candidatus Poseidoniaceae archaeon]
MSDFGQIKAIALKELIDYVRDWRTLLAIVLVPLLLFPILFIALPLLLESEYGERQEFELSVIVQSNESVDDLNQYLLQSEINLTWENLPTGIANLSDTGTDDERIRSGQIHSILRLQKSAENTTTWKYAILYDSTDERAGEAHRRLLVAIFSWEDGLINATLENAGLDPQSTLDPVQWDGDSESADVATTGEQAGFALSLFIPLIVATWTATAAMQPAIDMTAGERERGTLEALLCAPISRIDLLVGKWVAVATIAAISVLIQIFGLFLALAVVASGSSVLEVPTLSLLSLGLIISAVLIFAVMTVAFQLALAVRSHSVKEAGTVLGPIILLIIIPAIFAQLINLEGIEYWWFLIPVVNILIALRELLTDTVILEHILLWAGSSLGYALMAAWYASRQFNREDLVESIN